MIIKKRPEGKTLSPKNLHNILCGEEDKSVNVIENIIQRELVWTFSCIEGFWHDVLECIKININAVKGGLFDKVFDKAYMDAGTIEYSRIDKCNKEKIARLDIGEHKSIVDGSQRIRISLFMVLAFMYEITKTNKNDYIDLSHFKSDNNEYKLMEIGIEGLNNFYEKIKNTKISELSKDINNLTIDKISHKFKNENEERDYFSIFALYVGYIERDIIGTYNIDDAFKIIMNNVYFYEEFVDEESKFERFVDRNKKGTPMSDESMYPKYIINQFDDGDKEEVYNAFKRFKSKAEDVQIKPRKEGGRFRNTKNGLDAILYIMIEILKISLGKEFKNGKDIDLKCVFSSTFDLKNIDYGIEKCFRKNLVFNTANDAINYFNECYDLAEFLNESFTRHDNIYDDCYYLRDFSSQDVLWWYFIKPSYIADSQYKNDRSRFEFIKKMMYIIYVFYIVHRSGDTNSQNVINLLERISSLMVTFKGNDNEFEKVVKTEVKKYITNAGGYDELYSTVFGLNYKIKSNRNAIEAVFIAMEYDLCEKFGLDTGTFYSLWKRRDGKTYNLDHWLPENKFKDEENWVEYHQLGNMVLLEKSLNKSKKDEIGNNSKCYTQSNYIQTKLFNDENRGAFSNKTLNEINSYPYFIRMKDTEINNPQLSQIRERTKKYAIFFTDFIKKFVEE